MNAEVIPGKDCRAVIAPVIPFTIAPPASNLVRQAETVSMFLPTNPAEGLVTVDTPAMVGLNEVIELAATVLGPFTVQVAPTVAVADGPIVIATIVANKRLPNTAVDPAGIVHPAEVAVMESVTDVGEAGIRAVPIVGRSCKI